MSLVCEGLFLTLYRLPSDNEIMENIGTLLSIEASTDDRPSSQSVYDGIRHDILSGALPANVRLKVSELATRYNTSTNPVREALQQLRGEGLVLFSPNQGARVRAIDTDFVRDVSEVGLQLEPYLLQWFVETVTAEDITHLEEIQDRIEELNFADKAAHTKLNTEFHTYMYKRHYNRVAFNLWNQHRELMASISTRVPISLGRREAIFQEHRGLIEHLRHQDGPAATALLSKHIRDAGRHLVDQLRIEEVQKANQKTA